MKFWNLTYNDPNRWQEVYAICGKPLNFWQSLKSGGSGSPRGILFDAPGELKTKIGDSSNIKYCNVQRMSGGGLLYFKVRLEVYGIPISSGEVLRVERIVRTAGGSNESGQFACIIRLVFRSQGQIDIGCSEINAAKWQAFLGEVFL